MSDDNLRDGEVLAGPRHVHVTGAGEVQGGAEATHCSSDRYAEGAAGRLAAARLHRGAAPRGGEAQVGPQGAN
eukprot:2587573-Pyramimonas_sp.AAC.1